MTAVAPLSRLAVLLGLLAASGASAVEPITRHHGRFADFEGGDGHGVTLRSDGQLALGPALDSLAKVEAQRVWSLAADGQNLWIGTGDDGRVYRLADDGEPAQLLFDSPEIGIQALLPTADGAYAGTSPDGLIYRIDGDGEATTVARTGSRYVWDLARDQRGRLLVATGGPARVLRVDGNDIDTLFEARRDGHVRCLAPVGERLFVGTAVAGDAPETGTGPPRRGRVYEVTDSGGRLVLETDVEEVTHLVGIGDTLFAAAVSTPAAGQGNHGNEPEARAVLLRIEPGGAAYPLWQGTGVWAGLAVDDGWLTAVLREPARVLRVRPDGRLHERVAHTDSLMPNAIELHAGQLVLGDGLSGRLSRLAPAPGDSGSFDGPVEDLGAHGRWGAIEWEASVPSGTDLRLRTRSGNSAAPDDTWSEWSDAISESGASIPSPAARYLQYRLVLASTQAGQTPRVRRVSFTALQTNLPPRIDELTTFAYRGNQQGKGPPPPPAGNGQRNGRGLPQSKSLRMVRWQASDPNGDQLSYSVYLRGEGQREWKLVEDDLDKTTVVWDTENMPEGTTQLRLEASDAPDNAPAWALEDDYVSEPFSIDNSPPLVRLQNRREEGETVFHVTMEDRVTAVHGARYTLDYDDDGTRLAPADGVFDSRRETSTFRLRDLTPGEHVISVQAWDALDNVGVARALVEIE